MSYNSLNAKDYIFRLFNKNHNELISKVDEQVAKLSEIISPQFGLNGQFDGFENWHKDAGTLTSCHILTIKPPAIGSDYPKFVQAEIEIDMSIFSTTVQESWLGVKSGELLALVSYKNTKTGFKISTMRLCEVQSLVYTKISDIERCKEERQAYLMEQKIRLHILFDPVQFKQDHKISADENQNIDEIYESFKVALRMDRQTSTIKHALDKLKAINKHRISDLESQEESETAIFGSDILYNLRFDQPELEDDLFLDPNINYSLLFPNEEYFTELFKENAGINERLREVTTFRPSTTACDKFLTRQQVKAIMSCICKPVTMITGDYGTGKCFSIINAIKLLLSSPKSGRVLIVTKTDNQLDYLCEKLDPKYLVRFGGFRGYREVDISQNDRVIKGKDLSPNGQVDRLLKRRLQLLKTIRQFAESVSYTVFEDFTCERAGLMYKSFLIPKQSEFKAEIGYDDEKVLASKTTEDWDKYPFKNFIKQLLYPDMEMNIFTDDSFENKQRINSYWEYIKSIFEEISEYTPLEMIREQKEREKFVLCSFSKIVGMTSSFLVINNVLKDYNLQYDTIVLMHVDKMTELEKFLALNLQKNNAHLKRIILLGHTDQCKINEVNLSDPTCDQIVRRNPSVHLIPIFGTPKYLIEGSDLYQNLEEAQFLHSVYMYIRLMGQPKFTISVISSSHGQVELLRDMVRNNSMSWYEKIGNPKVIVHIDDYQGQENEVVLVSLVRSDFEDLDNLYHLLSTALSRATKATYLFGNFSELFATCTSKHIGLYNLCRSLPPPSPFRVNQNGFDVEINSNRELVDILNQIL